LFLCRDSVTTPKLITGDRHLPDCELTVAKKTLTTEQGIPVTDNRNSLASGQRGPVLIKDIHLIEKLEMT
jgi:catalase